MQLLAKLASRKFLLALIGLYVIVAKDFFGMEIAQETADAVVRFLQVVIGVFGGVDIVKAFKE